MSHSRVIPDRWTDYKPVGSIIQGTRFIAFKVPLRKTANERVEESVRLDGDMLLEAIPDLGLIIDLTNTTKYYDPKYFENSGVEYRKIQSPGKIVPTEDLIRQFKRYVQEYLRYNKRNNKLIGVHCTHGVNRTGFFICNYMISEMTMNPDEAIEKFCEARGHPIERVNYIDALKRKGSSAPPIYRNRNAFDRNFSRSNSTKNSTNFQELWNAKSNYNNYNHSNHNQHQGGDFYTRSQPPTHQINHNNRRFYNRLTNQDERNKVDYNTRWNSTRRSTNVTNWRDRQSDDQRPQRSLNVNAKFSWKRNSRNNTESEWRNKKL